MRKLGLGLLVHDVGKLAVPPEILNKPGRLTDDEMDGHEDPCRSPARSCCAPPTSRRSRSRSSATTTSGSTAPATRRASTATKVQEFPRIAAVADVYDAVTSERVYKPAAPPHVGVAVIRNGSGGQFCPNVVRNFRAVVMPYPVGHEILLPDGRTAVVASRRHRRARPPDRPRHGRGRRRGVRRSTWPRATPSRPRRAAPPRDGRDAAVVQADGQRGLRARGRGARHRLARGVLDQRVAALERALRVVGGERGGEAREVAAAALERGGGSAAVERARASRRGRAARARAAPPTRRERLCARAARWRATSVACARRPRPPGGSPRAARAGAGAGARGGGRRGGRARARAGPACGRARPPRGGPGARAARRSTPARARAAPQSTGTAVSAAWVGVEHATAATSSSSVRSVWWPTEEITGTRSSATVRHSVSSQNANRSASEPPPRATTITSTSAQAARSCSARRIAGAAWRSWTGANAHTSRPAQPRRRSPASTSSRALPDSPVTTPMQRGSTGRGKRLLRREQALRRAAAGAAARAGRAGRPRRRPAAA